MKANTPAITDAAKRVMIAGTFLTIRSPVRTGTSRSHGDILNFEARSIEKSTVSALLGA